MWPTRPRRPPPSRLAWQEDGAKRIVRSMEDEMHRAGRVRRLVGSALALALGLSIGGLAGPAARAQETTPVMPCFADAVGSPELNAPVTGLGGLPAETVANLYPANL